MQKYLLLQQNCINNLLSSMLKGMQAIVKNDVIAIIEQLRQTSLQPGDVVNRLYGELVALALDPQDGIRELLQLTRQQLREVHDICAVGESSLEMYWAKKIQASENPVAELLNFPYLDNYLKLSGQELALFVKYLPKSSERQLAYIGAGPLPLTAICYERHGFFTEVIGIDSDQEALSASRQLCAKLGSGVSFLHADAMEVDYSGFSVIFIAALVGMTSDEKQRILQYIQKTAKLGTLVAVRSAYGSRELLYPKLGFIPKGYREVDSYIPTDDVVNSVHILKIIGDENE